MNLMNLKGRLSTVCGYLLSGVKFARGVLAVLGVGNVLLLLSGQNTLMLDASCCLLTLVTMYQTIRCYPRIM